MVKFSARSSMELFRLKFTLDTDLDLALHLNPLCTLGIMQMRSIVMFYCHATLSVYHVYNPIIAHYDVIYITKKPQQVSKCMRSLMIKS